MSVGPSDVCVDGSWFTVCPEHSVPSWGEGTVFLPDAQHPWTAGLHPRAPEGNEQPRQREVQSELRPGAAAGEMSAADGRGPHAAAVIQSGTRSEADLFE